ncbi:putative methyltransferase [Cladophialophora carrionii]|uniref:Putative methyltransferase n=1 Tax=Cladophialophora carrionii TaxID=86049 RepID=A0A1C1CY68_9EURO|nr:putative methyltransferase [Cladophialophora carrionii]
MVLLPTPSTSHVPYDLVYEPAEDSFLFLDTLSSPSETAWLHSRFRDAVFTTTTTTGRTPLLLEIGPGSGVIVAFLTANATHIFGTEVLSLGVDVNPHAALATRTTVGRALAEQRHQGVRTPDPNSNSIPIPSTSNSTSNSTSKSASASANPYLASLLGDLTAPLRPGEVDVLVFNPPYVPTESVPLSMSMSASMSMTMSGPRSTATATETETAAAAAAAATAAAAKAATTAPSFEESSKLLELSYAGGLDGMEVTNRLLAQLPLVLSPRGVAYVLLCRGNRPEEVKRRIEAWEGSGGGGGGGGGHGEHGRSKWKWKWRAQTVGSSGKTAGWEKLEIVRIWREWEGESEGEGEGDEA